MKASFLFYHKQTHLALHSSVAVQVHIKHSSTLLSFLSNHSLPSLSFISFPFLFIQSFFFVQGEMTTEVNCSLFMQSFLCKYGAIKSKLDSAAASSHGALMVMWCTVGKAHNPTLVPVTFSCHSNPNTPPPNRKRISWKKERKRSVCIVICFTTCWLKLASVGCAADLTL